MDCLRRLPDALALRDLLSRSGVHPPAANRLDLHSLIAVTRCSERQPFQPTPGCQTGAHDQVPPFTCGTRDCQSRLDTSHLPLGYHPQLRFSYGFDFPTPLSQDHAWTESVSPHVTCTHRISPSCAYLVPPKSLAVRGSRFRHKLLRKFSGRLLSFT